LYNLLKISVVIL